MPRPLERVGVLSRVMAPVGIGISGPGAKSRLLCSVKWDRILRNDRGVPCRGVAPKGSRNDRLDLQRLGWLIDSGLMKRREKVQATG